MCLGSLENDADFATEVCDELLNLLIDGSWNGDWSSDESVFNRQLLSRAYLCVGLAHKALSSRESNEEKKKLLQKSCIGSLFNAFKLDQKSHVNAFSLCEYVCGN